jgi:GntR family transcriptional regulator
MSNRMIPRYIQIANSLRRQIVQQSLSSNQKLPSQRELADQYRTTLSTVRQAIRVLEEENLIRTEHGSGSFINSSPFQENSIHLLGFSKEMIRHNLAIETRLLSINNSRFNAEVSQLLQQPLNQPLVQINRLRLFCGKPIVLQHSYLSYQFLNCAQTYQPNLSLYEHLQQSAGVLITDAREILKPILLNNEQAALLQRQPNDPALLSMRVSFHMNAVPIIYDEAFLPADSFVVTAERFGTRTRYQFHLLSQENSDILSLLIPSSEPTL